MPAAEPRTSAMLSGIEASPSATATAAVPQLSTCMKPRSTAGSLTLCHQAGIDSSANVTPQQQTAIVKPAIPTGSSSRCQARSFHCWPSEKIPFSRCQIEPACHSL